MTSYNLTASQKELLRKLVECDSKNRFREKGILALTRGPNSYVALRCDFEFESLADLKALCDEGLLVEEPTRQRHNYRFRITNKGAVAVENNFIVPPQSTPASFTFQNVSNSPIQIQSDSPHATQKLTYTYTNATSVDLTEFTNQLEELIKQLATLNLDDIRTDLGKLKLRLDTIRLYLNTDQQDPTFMEESVKTTRNVLEGMLASSIVTAALSPEVHQLAVHLLQQTSLLLTG